MKPMKKYIKIDDKVIAKGGDIVLEPVWWGINIYDGESIYLQSKAKFSKEQCLLFAVEWYIAEVNNGGHNQFYWNSTGIVWRDALAGFSELGFTEVVQIIQESAARMGGEPSLDRSLRQDQLEMYQPNFDDLDDRFYKIEGIYDAMDEYFQNHRSAFYFEGVVEKYA